MTDKAKDILSKLGGGEVKGVAFELAPKLREATKEYGVQYFATIITLKKMGLTDMEAHAVVDEIAGVEWEKLKTFYEEALYEMASKG